MTEEQKFSRKISCMEICRNLLNAIDETFSQTVHTRSFYKAEEIKSGYKIANIYNKLQIGEPLSIDIRKLSQIEMI